MQESCEAQPDHPLSVGAVILAAGSSQRMGRPKMLLPWRGTSVLGHIIEQWHGLGAEQVAVVISSSAPDLQQELERLQVSRSNWIQNPSPERGMFSSVQCAANWAGWSQTLTHWALLLGDQPHLRLESLHQLLDFAAFNSERACQPIRGSRWRHPVILPKALFEQLTFSNARNLREFLAGWDRAGFQCDDPGLDQDIDTPEDYIKALNLGL